MKESRNPTEKSPSIEQEEKPRLRLMITRHAERIPSGELSPEGVRKAGEKGKNMQGKAEVLKGYASNEKSKRTVDTSNLISKGSGIESPQTGDAYSTKEVKDIQYDILNPDLAHVLKEAPKMINDATLEELDKTGKYSLEKDADGNITTELNKLSKGVQIEIAPIRQKNQIIGLRHVMKNSEAVNRLAMGLAHQELKELGIAKRYVHSREEKKPLEGDVILNTNTHGLFVESLLTKAGFYVDEKGEKTPIADIEDENIGGFMQPGESITLDIGEDPSNPPQEIPVIFEGENRPQAGKVFIDLKKMQELDEEYIKWKEAQKKK
ncbi:MAG: hypothetical protein V1688_02370 [bacterium]